MLRGAAWRIEQDHRRAVLTAWVSAALARTPARKRLPRLESLIGDGGRQAGPRPRQTLDEQRAHLHHLAASMGHTMHTPNNGGPRYG